MYVKQSLKEESNPEGTVHAHPNYPTVYRCVFLAFGWPFGARGLSRAAAANTPDETPEHTGRAQPWVDIRVLAGRS
jgi:hypothetical protein